MEISKTKTNQFAVFSVIFLVGCNSISPKSTIRSPAGAESDESRASNQALAIGRGSWSGLVRVEEGVNEDYFNLLKAVGLCESKPACNPAKTIRISVLTNVGQSRTEYLPGRMTLVIGPDSLGQLGQRKLFGNGFLNQAASGVVINFDAQDGTKDSIQVTMLFVDQTRNNVKFQILLLGKLVAAGEGRAQGPQ